MTNQTVERQTSRLLIDEEPLQVLPSLAELIGVNEAIVLQQLHYWLNKSPHRYHGRPWIYNSYPQWHKQFRFLKERTLRRVIATLKQRGLIDTDNFHRSQSDRSLWYSINYEVLAALLTSARPTATSSGQIGHMGTNGPQASTPSHQKSSGQIGHITWPNWPHHLAKLATSPGQIGHTTEKDLREGSTEIPPSGGGSAPPQNNHGRSQQPRKPPPPPRAPTRAMPPDYEPSAALRAELEAKYPALNFAEELDRIRECVELTRPTADWDVATRRLFRRAEDHRKKGIAPPRQGRGDPLYGPEVMASITAALEEEAALPRKDHD